MIRTLIIATLILTGIGIVNAQSLPMATKSIHQFVVTDIEGNPYDLGTLKGRKVMIVNTASECGYTPQYKDLQELYLKYKDSGFVVIGFPSNDFGEQEPGSNAEIATFCKRNYGVTFPMMSRISVKGHDMHPLYHFLTSKAENGKANSEVKWNFQKYLINRDGSLEGLIEYKKLPADEEVIRWIESK